MKVEWVKPFCELEYQCIGNHRCRDGLPAELLENRSGEIKIVKIVRMLGLLRCA